MKTLMVMLILVISLLMIQVDGFPFNGENILGEMMDSGQVTHICSNTMLYPDGCCRDLKTKPQLKKHQGYNKDEACALEMCYDVDYDYCQANKNECNKYDRVTKRCPNTCGKCKKNANPKLECEEKNPHSPYGCCWNGIPATGPNNQGCLPCRNLRSRRLCQKMKYDESCQTARYGTSKFLVENCPEFCGLC